MSWAGAATISAAALLCLLSRLALAQRRSSRISQRCPGHYLLPADGHVAGWSAYQVPVLALTAGQAWEFVNGSEFEVLPAGEARQLFAAGRAMYEPIFAQCNGVLGKEMGKHAATAHAILEASVLWRAVWRSRLVSWGWNWPGLGSACMRQRCCWTAAILCSQLRHSSGGSQTIGMRDSRNEGGAYQGYVTSL